MLWVTSTRVSLSTARIPFSQENEGHSEVSNLDGHNAWSHEPDTGLGRPPPRRSLEPQNHRDIKCGRGAAISGAGWWGQLCETSCPGLRSVWVQDTFFPQVRFPALGEQEYF